MTSSYHFLDKIIYYQTSQPYNSQPKSFINTTPQPYYSYLTLFINKTSQHYYSQPKSFINKNSLPNYSYLTSFTIKNSQPYYLQPKSFINKIMQRQYRFRVVTTLAFFDIPPPVSVFFIKERFWFWFEEFFEPMVDFIAYQTF